MSISEDRNSDPTTENMEEEDKVNVEEAGVNLDCVKKELDEEELQFEHKQYKIALTFENMFGESSTEQRSNRVTLIGFLNGDVIVETGSVKLEDVKEENKDLIQKTIKQSHCNKCGGNYQGYCLNCSSLSRILNNLTANLNTEPVLNTIPRNMFEIREVSRGCAVFALKSLPKGIILGPFEGIVPIESTTGLQWKIKNKKLLTDQNGNWMKYIESIANPSSRNLDVFQIDGILYFETSREIQEGEELLVCYREGKEEMLKSDKEEAFYLVPVNKEEYPNVFACTLCCLGFRLESCLVEHKSKCPLGDHEGGIEDFEIIQCRCCKVWLEKEEYLASHMLHCLENYNRSCRNRNSTTTTDNEEQVYENDDVNASYSTPPTETIGSNNCFSRTDFQVHKGAHFHDKNMGTTQSNANNLKSHLGSHTKNFQCDICKRRFGHKCNLNAHIKNKHSNTTEKEYKCSKCFYQTNLKSHLHTHIKNKHSNTNEKEYKCSNCFYQTNYKSNLQTHIKNKHSNTNEKEYKCSKCFYQTNYKTNLQTHIKNKHSNTNEKEYKCSKCFYQTNLKSNIQTHIKNKHSNTNEKEYKCSECSYQTNLKSNLKLHLGTHTKNFQCDICKQRFAQKGHLKVHIQNKHSNTNEKEYKCSKCFYQTNLKSNLQRHKKNKHSNTNVKEYKCSECSFATIYKTSLKNHLVSHTGIKDFRCDICKLRFGQKGNLIMHIKNKHSNPNKNEYKCSECSYQTNYKGNFKKHLDIHSNPNEKEYKCSECSFQTNYKGNLKKHLGIHSNPNEKEYKCSAYQTNHITHLKVHLVSHTGDKQHFQCDICKQRFGQKCRLKLHIKNKHSNTNEKEYKCSECSYQTNYKSNFKVHLGTHSDDKHFQCEICKQGFAQKVHLKVHIQNKHSNTNKKEYKCSECSYQTNYKGNFKTHLVIHSNRNEKEYKCSECPYQTNRKGDLNVHLYTHTGIKNFECDICKQRFSQKGSLNVHVKNKHSNTSEKEYKCPNVPIKQILKAV